MDTAEKARIIGRYNERLEQYGDDVRTLASGTEERRRIRFQVLTEVGLTAGSSVLDLGCGFGDFYGYLCERGLNVSCTGYDINPQLVDIARRKYPTGSFETKDIQVEAFPMFDYVVSTSAFNLRLAGQDNYSFVTDILTRCFQHARQGVAIDFLTSHVDFESPAAFHYDPERLFRIAKRISKRVCLRHDYPLYEFCLYLYPDFQGWHTKHGCNQGMHHI